MDTQRSEAIKAGKERARRMGRLVGKPLKISDTQIRETIDLAAAEVAEMFGITVRWVELRRRQTGLVAARGAGRHKRVTDAAINAVLHMGTKAGSEAVGLSLSWFITRRRRLIERKEKSARRRGSLHQ